ncbi:hypothetical protein [Micromonospora craniellae]|uniref:Uncharacterized protein n=1 Tax=Micromonospora craniellae TaxID=2294034 RepID=A0A372FXP7_9ACTN|nr:hypothetical protein [Micromonospora craniellae]RFS45562.1 hypothetical protein D0Q02_15780 [Micromonospora craniellae]
MPETNPNGAGGGGGGETIIFDSATFDRLIKFMTECKRELDSTFLKATADLRLDNTLGEAIKPGSPTWPVVQAVKSQANTFGGDVRARLVKLSNEWDQYIKALIEAKAIFEESDNLATLSANELITDFPSLLPTGGSLLPPPGGGGASPPPPNSTP